MGGNAADPQRHLREPDADRVQQIRIGRIEDLAAADGNARAVAQRAGGRYRHAGGHRLRIADRDVERLGAEAGRAHQELIAGRGRTGRQWLEAPRAVAASLAVVPSWPKDEWPRLTLVAGLAAVDAVDDPDVDLDWPNDLVRGDVKVGGLIAEAEGDVVVFGLGVNLWWPDPPQGMGAIGDEDPGPDAALAVADSFAQGLLAIRQLYDFDGLDKHRGQHHRLYKEVNELIERFKYEGPSKGLKVELQYLVTDWYVLHIKEWDKPFADFMRSKNVSAVDLPEG